MNLNNINKNAKKLFSRLKKRRQHDANHKMEREQEIIDIITQNFGINSEKTMKLVKSLKDSLRNQGIDTMGKGEYEKTFDIPNEIREQFGENLESFEKIKREYPLYPIFEWDFSPSDRYTLYLAYIIDRAFSELAYSSMFKNKKRKEVFFFVCKKITYPDTILIKIQYPGIINHKLFN